MLRSKIGILDTFSEKLFEDLQININLKPLPLCTINLRSFNPSQDGPFRGCSRMEGQQGSLP